MRQKKAAAFPAWHDSEGKTLSGAEKIKLLNENLEELRALAQDAFEDALLMGCDEGQTRKVLAETLARLENPYRR